MALSAAELDLFATVFVTFFVVIDAIGVAPVFYSLTHGYGGGYRARMAIKATIVAAAILLVFGLGGQWLLDKLHVSLDAFKVGGGILLFLMALDMLFEKRTERRGNRADAVREEAEAAAKPPDISVFPVGIPMIAGPGAIASIMLFMAKERGEGDLVGQAIVMAAVGVNLAIALVLFLAVGLIMRVIGETMAAMITRIFGVILAALSAQFVLDGVKGAFGLG